MTDIKYVAFDLHKSTISVAVLNLEGKLVTQAVIQTDAIAIRDFLRGISGCVHLTFEEGCNAQWLFELARPLVAELIVCNAKPIASVGNKSDRLDALKLAQYCSRLFFMEGVRPEMARLTIARKLAAVTLCVWKSGEEFNEKKLTKIVA
jgi:hypothetical protein